MKTHNFDYAYIGLTCARIGSQLKEEYKLNLSCSFGQSDNDNYCFISIHRASDSSCVKTFYRSDWKIPQELMDNLFEYCMENDLFKQPLDIKLVD